MSQTTIVKPVATSALKRKAPASPQEQQAPWKHPYAWALERQMVPLLCENAIWKSLVIRLTSELTAASESTRKTAQEKAALQQQLQQERTRAEIATREVVTKGRMSSARVASLQATNRRFQKQKLQDDKIISCLGAANAQLCEQIRLLQSRQ